MSDQAKAMLLIGGSLALTFTGMVLAGGPAAGFIFLGWVAGLTAVAVVT